MAPVPPLKSPTDLLRLDQVQEILSFAPHYHMCALGPVPIGQRERLVLTLDCVLQPDVVSALQALESRCREVCDTWNHAYDADEWELVHVVPRNCN